MHECSPVKDSAGPKAAKMNEIHIICKLFPPLGGQYKLWKNIWIYILRTSEAWWTIERNACYDNVTTFHHWVQATSTLYSKKKRETLRRFISVYHSRHTRKTMLHISSIPLHLDPGTKNYNGVGQIRDSYGNKCFEIAFFGEIGLRSEYELEGLPHERVHPRMKEREKSGKMEYEDGSGQTDVGQSVSEVSRLKDPLFIYLLPHFRPRYALCSIVRRFKLQILSWESLFFTLGRSHRSSSDQMVIF